MPGTVARPRATTLARMNEPGSQSTALVTGAARGIGRATVLALRAAGWRVVAGVRDPATAPFGDDDGVLTVRIDVTDHDSVREGVAAAEEWAGGALHALVSNAGYAVMGPGEVVPIDVVRAVFETNMFGALAVTQAVLPAMRDARRGRLVVVSSIGAHLPVPGVGVYRASKAAFDALADSMRIELRPFGIAVTRLEPGMVATEFSQSTVRAEAMSDPDHPYAPIAQVLIRGYGGWREWNNTPPEMVADAVVAAVTADDPPAVLPVGIDAELAFRDGYEAFVSHVGLDAVPDLTDP